MLRVYRDQAWGLWSLNGQEDPIEVDVQSLSG